MQAEVAQKRGWGFVNFNTVMCGLNKQIQLSDSTATFCGGDRIHPDKDGHMVMAYLFLKAQGLAGQEIASFQTMPLTGKQWKSEIAEYSYKE